MNHEISDSQNVPDDYPSILLSGRNNMNERYAALDAAEKSIVDQRWVKLEKQFKSWLPKCLARLRGGVPKRVVDDDDMFQIVIRKCAMTRPFDREIGPFEVKAVAKNLFKDLNRHQEARSGKNRESLDAPLGEDLHLKDLLEDGVPSSSDVLRKIELARLQDEASKCLTETQWNAIKIRYFEEIPPEEAGQRLGITKSAFNATLNRARARLNERLKKLGVGPSDIG